MAAITFPSSPSSGQVFTDAGSAWNWDGTAWRVVRKTNSLPYLDITKIDFGSATVLDAKFFSTTLMANEAQWLGTTPVKAIGYNAQIISEDITIPGTYNAYSAGPITVNSAYTVTVSSGTVWTVI